MRFMAKVLLMVVAGATMLFAQAQQPAPAAGTQSKAPAGKSKGMRHPMREHHMEMQEQMKSKQVPEMAKVEKALAGEWKTSVKYEPSPEMGMPDGATAQGMAMIHAGPGGNSLMEMFHSRSQMGPFAGAMVLWYDGNAKQYRRVWCDSDAPSCDNNGTGNWDGDNLVFTSSGDMGGQKYQTKETIGDIKPNSFTFTLEMGMGDQAPKRAMTITYTRAKGEEKSEKK